jgi:hypothetical protein
MKLSWILKSLAAMLLVGLLFAQAEAGSLAVLSDDELDSVQAGGFYFLMDLSLQVLSDSSTAPQVVLNSSSQAFPTSTTVSGSVGSAGDISISGNAQSNLHSLINVIGSASVINIGLNIVNITNSTNDVINSTNLNAGAQGSNFAFVFSLPPP